MFNNVKKVCFVQHFIKKLTDYSTQQYCQVKFSFKFFEKGQTKETFWKLLTCTTQ